MSREEWRKMVSVMACPGWTITATAHIQDFLGCARFLLSDFDHLHHAVPAKDIDLFRGADRLPAFRTNQLAGAAGVFAAQCGAGSCLGCSPGGSRADKGR